MGLSVKLKSEAQFFILLQRSVQTSKRRVVEIYRSNLHKLSFSYPAINFIHSIQLASHDHEYFTTVEKMSQVAAAKAVSTKGEFS